MPTTTSPGPTLRKRVGSNKQNKQHHDDTQQLATQSNHAHRHHHNAGLYGHRPQPRENLLDVILKKQSQEKEKDILQTSDFQGFVNLAFMMLVAATFQLAVKSYLSHGTLVDLNPFYCFAYDPNFLFAVLLWVGMCLWSHSVYLFEVLRIRHQILNVSHFCLYAGSQIMLYGCSMRVISRIGMPPLISGVLCITMIVCSMKMHSYYATNRNLEKKKKTSNNKLSHVYPINVNFSNFFYYMMAPTLVYDPVFPRSIRIRKRYLLKEFVASLACWFMIYIIFVQFVLPVLKEDIDFLDPTKMAFDCVRLAIPSILMWVLGFYAFFHCTLNFLSEMLRFADRRFYEDWWNAPTLEEFWRKWNLPVHEWMFRHVFLESVYSGKISKMGAMLVTFSFSAILHEVLVGVAFGLVRPWFFLAMFGQVPLILLNRFLITQLTPQNQKRWGNILVWSSLFIGQPLIELLYTREWFRENTDFFCTVSK
eukprot:TRINITY_DN3530_c0_g1_i1.p1 TRINITY_DN3530_c0_g1~~TRINITY_DN3530_c0_g1_i1.p1  ORF type:complete len:478 (-),score=68.88 TRINITY_DN3530_c0_g1_i1:64-1497(-)